MKAQRKNQSATTYNGKQSNHTLRFFLEYIFISEIQELNRLLNVSHRVPRRVGVLRGIRHRRIGNRQRKAGQMFLLLCY